MLTPQLFSSAGSILFNSERNIGFFYQTELKKIQFDGLILQSKFSPLPTDRPELDRENYRESAPSVYSKPVFKICLSKLG